MKKPYLLIITAILCLVLTGGMSLAKDSDVEAIGSYTQAIRINPDDAKVHYNLGIAYVNSGMDKKAIESYKQAIRINPDDAKAHFKLGLDAAFDDKGPVLEQYKILKRLDSELANKLFNFIYE